MATMAEPSLTLPVIRAEIATALDLIVHIGRLESGSTDHPPGLDTLRYST